MDIHYNKQWETLPSDVNKIVLADKIEAYIDTNGSLKTRESPVDEWTAKGSFAEPGYVYSSPRAKNIGAYGTKLWVVDDAGGVWKLKNDEFQQVDWNPESPEEIAVDVEVYKDRVSILTKKGDVYMMGNNQFGQCGIGPLPHTGSFFIKIPSKFFAEPVEQISLGGRHTLFRTQDGRVYSCGSNDHMQLGLCWSREKCWLADLNWAESSTMGARQQISKMESMDSQRSYYDTATPELFPRVCLGKMFSGHCYKVQAGESHSMALIAETQRTPAEVYSWGCCMRGQLGNRNSTNMCEPNIVGSMKEYREYDEEQRLMTRCAPADIQVGDNHSIILLEGPSTTMVFLFGDNKDHQCFSNRQRKYTQPTWLKIMSPINGYKVSRIVAGGNKSAVMCEEVDMYADISSKD